MSSEIAIDIKNLSKCHYIYERPQDRLKKILVPRLQKAVGLKPSNYGKEFWAVKNLSFEVKKGEIVGIIGKNGSGKSTLLQMICGTLNPTSGTIKTHGRIAALLELGSGFNPEFTGRENIYLNAAMFGLDENDVNDKLDEIIAFADIGEFIDQPIKTYSTGMSVRLAFSVVAHVDADILVIDEALSVGDAFFVQKCMRFLRQFIEHGTLLFCSHDMGAIRSLCTKVALVEKGSLIALSDPKTVSELYLEKLHHEKHGVLEKKVSNKGNQSAPDIVGDIHNLDFAREMEKLRKSKNQNGFDFHIFDPQANSFGVGGVEIKNIIFKNADKKPINWIDGFEFVTLEIEAQALEEINSPIVGFFIRDKNGQNLFGENTFLSNIDSPLILERGTSFTAHFSFNMPRLANGNYFITAAVASGVQDNHIQHCWMHDALTFKSSGIAGVTGIIGLPMVDIRIEKV